MQQLTGVLIEYLAIGSASALWIVLLRAACTASLPSDKDHPAVLLLFLRLIYVLGMISDFFGALILHGKKKAIQIATRRGTAVQELTSRQIHARIVDSSPELTKELNARSSRDRIARGILVNVPLIGISTVVYYLLNPFHRNPNSYVYVVTGLTIMITTLLTFIVYLMWKRFQEHSYKYELESISLQPA